MSLRKIIPLVLFISVTALNGSADLSFQSAEAGTYGFDTGIVKGKMIAEGASQGIVALTDDSSGQDIAYGKPNPGIFSYYRIFSTNKRYGDAVRDWPRTATVLPDGALRIHWPAQPEHPLEITAVYRWKSGDTLDLETEVKPQQTMPKFEVFLSSYFSKNFRGRIYAKPGSHAPGKPAFLDVDVNLLVRGTYLAFPRDLRAAQIIYDGRWDYEPNPVQFSLTQQLEAPLCMRQDNQSGISVVMMSRPQDCFAIATPYNMEPPDGVAGHNSLYFSLFGYDLQAGQTAKAFTRMVVMKNGADDTAVERYRQFIEETK